MIPVIELSELVKNNIITARMEGYTAQCQGVCRVEGRAVFVPGALLGELWRVRIVKVSSTAVWGRGEELLECVDARTVPDCEAYPRCGGCAARHMTYEEELQMKSSASMTRCAASGVWISPLMIFFPRRATVFIDAR